MEHQESADISDWLRYNFHHSHKDIQKLLQRFKISKLSLSFIEISITVFHVFLLVIRFSLLAISIVKQVFGGKGKDWLASKQWGWWQWDKSNKGSPLVTLAGSSFYPPNTIPPHYTIHIFNICVPVQLNLSPLKSYKNWDASWFDFKGSFSGGKVNWLCVAKVAITLLVTANLLIASPSQATASH